MAHLLRGARVRSRRCEGAGQKLVADGRRVGTGARRRRAEAEARRRWPAAGERGCGVRGDEAQGAGAAVRDCGHRTLGRRGRGIRVCLPGLLTGLGRIGRPDTCRMAYPICTKIIKNRILRGYVSWAYRTRIRIRYVSDTRYVASGTYPCNIGSQHWVCPFGFIGSIFIVFRIDVLVTGCL